MALKIEDALTTAGSHAFSTAGKQAVCRARHERRGMRHFSGGVVADHVPQRLLQMPEGTSPMTILCLGPVAPFDDPLMLQSEKWVHRAALADRVLEVFRGQNCLAGGTDRVV